MKKQLFAACLMALISCSKKAETPPISDEKMIRLMADFYSVEAVLNLGTTKQRDSLAPIYQAQIFDNQGVTKMDFEKTIDILSHDPARLDSILTRAARILDKKNNDTRPASSRPE